MESENDSSVADPLGSHELFEMRKNSDSENSPSSAAEQEVNKPLVNKIDNSELPLEKDHIEDSAAEQQLGCNDSNTLQIPNGESNGDVPKKVKRNVSFPADTMVLGYLEPPNPWKNVPKWRTEDLLKAYKKSCEKHGTRPLSKVLNQLQCIENVGERYEILSLKGERLDMKQCESLEEIFRLVRFRCVDLEATHLDDEMAVAMFEMLEYYESACKLNISFNKGIGPRGWQYCSRLVRKTPCLTNVDARNCDMNERVIPIMGRALRMGCYLTTLQLQNANLAGRALIILVAALKMNEILKELFIGDNKFFPMDGVQIGNLLKYNHKLELLDLRNNHLQDVGLGHVCTGLSEQTLNTGLLTLVLWNNQITFQGMSAINKALTYSENLETLNLGRNPITNEGIHILKDGLLKTRSLLKLGLSSTKVTCEGAVALAEVIADSPRLVRLDLQENEIKTAGLMALSLALKVNESLTRLDIDRDTKKESGIKDYAEQQKRLQQDIAAILDRNRDIAHKLEENRRQIEIKNQENARKLEEAAMDLESSQEETTEYIPSEDTIHRPKLLFLPYTCPEQELDSPILGDEFLQASSPGVTHLQLSAPGSDLLSPQYCENPKITAKKIFSVTRVSSPALASPVSDVRNSSTNSFATGTLASPMGTLMTPANSLNVPHLCTPLPAIGLPNSTKGTSDSVPVSFTDTTTQDIITPTSMQKAIEDETLVTYIQQIVGTGDGQSVLYSQTTGLNVQVKMESVGVPVNTNSRNNETNEGNDPAGENDRNTTCVERSTESNNVNTLEEKTSITDGAIMSRELQCGDSEIRKNKTDEKSAKEQVKETESDSQNKNLNGKIGREHVFSKCDLDGTLMKESVKENKLIGQNANNSNNPEEKVTKDVETVVNNDKSEACDNINTNIPNISDGGSDTSDNPVSIINDTEKDIIKIPESSAPDANDLTFETKYNDGPKEEKNEELNDEKKNEEVLEAVSEIPHISNSSQTHKTLLNCDSNDKYEEPYVSLSDMDMPSLTDTDNLPESEGKKDTDNENTISDNGLNGDFVDCEGDIIKEVDEIGNINPNTTSTVSDIRGQQSQKCSKKGKSDLEQWNTVNKSDINETDNMAPLSKKSDDNGNTNKPDFFTSLSLNGLKQELASMIDEEGNQTNPNNDASTNVPHEQPTVSVLPNGDNTVTDWVDAGSS